MVAMRGLTAKAFCTSILQPEIDQLGATAFENTGIVVLYSGPNDTIKSITKGIAANPPRSDDQAKRLNATRIDDTAIGKFLMSYGLYAYYEKIYTDDQDIRDAVQEIWAYASRAFVKTGFKQVATAVCGADENRVFRAHELKTILNGKKIAIETINGKPLIHYRRVYHAAGRGKTGFYAAFVEICQTELDEMQQAIAKAPSPAERKVVEEDYQSRKLFFELEQAAHDPTEVALAKLAAHNVALGAGRPKTYKARSVKKIAP